MIERGVIDVSLVDITRQAEANVALVSYHFKGREGLLIEIARDDAEYALASLERLLATELSAAEKLHRHIMRVVGVFFERPYLNRLLHALLLEGSEQAAEAVAEFFVKPLAEARRTIIREGIARGQFREVDADIIGLSIDGACEHIFSSAQARAVVFGAGTMTKDLAERHAQSMADLYVEGLLKHSQTE